MKVEHTFGPQRYEQPPTAQKLNTKLFYTLSPPSEGWSPAKSAHNEVLFISDALTQDGRTHILIHRHKAQPPPIRLWRPAPGHLAQGSKAVCRSNQPSQWETPLIQFYFISGEQTTRGVCTFLGSCGPGVILSLNDPRSDSNAVRARLKDRLGLTCRQNCVIFAGGETKTNIAHFLDTAGKSSRINDAIYQIIPDDQPPAKPGQHHRTFTHNTQLSVSKAQLLHIKI